MANMYYFAYGIYMVQNEIVVPCPEARFVGDGLLDNHKFLINQFGDATIIRDDESIVYGIIWDTSENEAKTLDAFEGVQFNNKYREFTAIDLGNRKRLATVLVHIAKNSTPGTPKKKYIKSIIKAARDNSFPVTYIDQLRSWAKRGKK